VILLNNILFITKITDFNLREKKNCVTIELVGALKGYFSWGNLLELFVAAILDLEWVQIPKGVGGMVMV